MADTRLVLSGRSSPGPPLSRSLLLMDWEPRPRAMVELEGSYQVNANYFKERWLFQNAVIN